VSTRGGGRAPGHPCRTNAWNVGGLKGLEQDHGEEHAHLRVCKCVCVCECV